MTTDDEIVIQELRLRLKEMQQKHADEKFEVERLKRKVRELEDEIAHLNRLRQSYMRRERPAGEKSFEEGPMSL